mmetsp:Transcript_43011/g.82056  ORF Transcript_43011/g.82056 Transcript_43011/m.82056 type:complete len:1338 (+) Transcript_43011:58-4071(+)
MMPCWYLGISIPRVCLLVRCLLTSLMFLLQTKASGPHNLEGRLLSSGRDPTVKVIASPWGEVGDIPYIHNDWPGEWSYLFNATFETYLNKLVGVEHNITFKMQFMEYSDLLHAIDEGAVDMVFLDAVKFSCSDRNNNLQPLATMRTRKFLGSEYYDSGHYHGAMIVRTDSNITKVEDVRDRTVELTSVEDLGGCQLQWDELQLQNVAFLSDIKQMRIVGDHNYARILQDVASGEVDVGFVASGMLQTAEHDGAVEPGQLRVLGNLQGSTSDPFYPFPFTTRASGPNWGLSALPWVEYQLRDAVAKALLAMPSTHEAAAAGRYVGWQVAPSYLSVRDVHARIDWVDDATLQCHNTLSFCESFQCPENYVRGSCEAVFKSCDAVQLACPEDAFCVCRPCRLVPALEFLVSPVHKVSESSSRGVALDITNETKGGNGTAVPEQRCEKMMECTSAVQYEEVHIQVTDEWFDLRPELGLEFVDYVEFNVHVGKFDSDTWAVATPVMEGEHARAFDIYFRDDEVGQKLVHIRTCRSLTASSLNLDLDFEQAECADLAASPTLVEVTLRTCPDHATTLSEDGRECVCLDEYKVDQNGVCVLDVGSDSKPYLEIFLSLLAALLVALALVAYCVVKRRQAESAWRIDGSELTFADPPEVLGQGSCGQVVKAEYRGTVVAVKRPFVSVQDRAYSLTRKSTSFNPDTPFLPTAIPGNADLNKSSSSAQAAAKGLHDERKAVVAPPQETVLDASAEHLMGAPNALDAIGEDVSTKTHDGIQVTDVHVEALNIEVGAEKYATNAPKSTDIPDKGAEIVVAIDQINSGSNSELVGGTRHARDSLGAESWISSLTLSPLQTWRSWLWSCGSCFNEKLNIEAGISGTISSRRAFAKQIQVMMQLRHPNIITVMGTVVERGQEPLMVMECMSQGNLHGLLQNTTMQLDSDIVTKILEGLVSGLMFLHAAHPPVLHMDLKSANVLVSGSFTPKLTDVGIVFSRKGGQFGTPFWMAPELLSQEARPSPETDVFAFGVTMYEIFTRQDPYEGEDVVDVLYRLRSGSEPDLRPSIPEAMPAEVKELIVQCWHTDPARRLKLPAVKGMIASLPRDKVDHWLATVEGKFKKTSSLRIAGQQKSAAQLLEEVFPPNIARTLREGKKVEPEHHECVTIFFSDIVGFTDISGSFKPLQVMNMLDRLYYAFDVAARRHDVFKVETIGDAYMAVANLVKQQPDHTKRIAEFAIDVIKTANRTLLDNDRPELGCVNIRVGFHSGPVVASVVGNMNPRFCLFGDTVNTASRMESNSQKNRIHMSEAAATNLKGQAPELEIECRGRIQIKGKGEQLTFWLTIPIDDAN